MKKTFILAAVAATLAAPAAFAQSSVTIYGRLNLSLEHQKTGNLTDNTVQNDASRIGFLGTEDLGGGLKAGFQLEHGFNAATGAQSQGQFWARQSEVNLGGDFGMIRMGRFTSEAYFAMADYVSMHNHDTGTSADALFADANGFNGSSKVSYRTPDLGGVKVEVAAQNATANGANPVARGYDVAANYEGGPLHLGAGYTKHDAASTFGVRALYEMGDFTFGGYVQRADNIAFDANQGLEVAGLGNRTTFRLSGKYVMGATELHLNVGHAGNTGSVSDSGATQFTLAVNQNLSKRTKVYAFYTKVNNQTNGAYMTDAAGVDFSSFALGIRQNF